MRAGWSGLASPYWPIALVLLIGLALRLLVFPGPNAAPQSDEIGYLTDGLLVAEGITPGYKFVPAAPTTWLAALYAGAQTMIRLVAPDPLLKQMPPTVRPIGALDRALFDIYADLSTLHIFVAGCVLLLALAGIACAARIGQRQQGAIGVLASGGLAALLPILVLLSTQSRPYAPGWSLLLLACAVAGSTWRNNIVVAGILFGLAVASRIDLAAGFPLILWFMSLPPRRFVMRQSLTAAGAAIVAFLVAAPWYLPHLLGNLRYIVSIRFLDPATNTITFAQILTGLWQEGIAGAAAIVVLGTLAAWRRLSWRVASISLYVAVLLVSVLQPSAFGLRHQGTFIVAAIVLLPWAMTALLAPLKDFWRGLGQAIVLIVVLAPAALPAVQRIGESREANVAGPWVEWIEANATPGMAVYIPEAWRIPLPTPQSASALWAQVASPNAWQTKLKAGLDRFGIATDALPHALSEEQLYQERANRRRYFILAQARDPGRPRFAVTPYSDGSAFDITHDQSVEMFCKAGGIYVARGVLPPRLGTPTISWSAPQGVALYMRTGPSC